MRFYIDENFPLDAVKELRNLGYDCLMALEDERANQKIPDEKVLKRAVELERAVLTMNRIDFKRIHNSNSEHTRIVICTFDADFVGQASRVNTACKELPEIKGQLVRVYRPS